MIFWEGKTIWAENRSVVARGWSVGRKVAIKVNKEFWGVMKLLYLDYGGSYMTVYVSKFAELYTKKG